MSAGVLRCAIEDLVPWHPQLHLEAHLAAFVAVTGQYSIPPAPFHVRCQNVKSRWLRDATEFRLEVSWTEETVDSAERVRATMQRKPLVEFAAIAAALILTHEILGLGQLDVTHCGDVVDYYSLSTRSVLEVSGTETLAELPRRHRMKVKQVLRNPFGRKAHVVVCAFADPGHQILLSSHRAKGVSGDAEEA